MSDYKYSYQGNKEGIVKTVGRLLPVSFKSSTQIARFIRGKNVDQAIALLQGVKEKKVAVPFVRYNADMSHRKGKVGPGRFPVNASKEIQGLLLGLKANAMELGMKPEDIVLIHTSAQKGPRLRHYGRHRGRLRKVCNFEIIGQEIKGRKSEAKKEGSRTEQKKKEETFKEKVQKAKDEILKKQEVKQEIKVEKKESKTPVKIEAKKEIKK